MQTKLLLILMLFVGGTCFLFPQESARERIARRQGTAQPHSPDTNNPMGRQQHSDEEIENAKWLRIIYRYLDLTKEANTPLYYPVTPVDGKMSLFTMLFNLLQTESVAAYEYLDGREAFTDEHRINFREFLDRFGIYYEVADGKIVVNDADIPGNEVAGYFVKEAYYFDTGQSALSIKPIAICPILQRGDDYGASTRYPLFWIPYDAIAPYAQRIPVMSSSLNNNMNSSVDDFFRMRKYDGDIYKAQNPRNLAITQYASTPEEVKAEQERIEQELVDFGKNLWKQETFPVTQQREASRKGRKKSAAAPPSGAAPITMRDRRF